MVYLNAFLDPEISAGIISISNYSAPIYNRSINTIPSLYIYAYFNILYESSTNRIRITRERSFMNRYTSDVFEGRKDNVGRLITFWMEIIASRVSMDGKNQLLVMRMPITINIHSSIPCNRNLRILPSENKLIVNFCWSRTIPLLLPFYNIK